MKKFFNFITGSSGSTPPTPPVVLKPRTTGITITKRRGSPPPTPSVASESQTGRGLDAYNIVDGTSQLTHQNVDRLLRDAFVKSGISERDVENLTTAGSIDVCAINNGHDNIDCILRDAILKFIGKDEPMASIALCRGAHLNSVAKRLSGGGHWIALHLRKVTRDGGTVSIEAVSMDSAGGETPAALTRVINSIVGSSVDSLYEKLNTDLQANEAFLRALARLRDGIVIDVRTLPCDHQKDWHSCGYHTVFNLIRMHDTRGKIKPTILQEGKQVGPEEFIRARRRDLEEVFNGRALHERVVPKTEARPPTKILEVTSAEQVAVKTIAGTQLNFFHPEFDGSDSSGDKFDFATNDRDVIRNPKDKSHEIILQNLTAAGKKVGIDSAKAGIFIMLAIKNGGVANREREFRKDLEKFFKREDCGLLFNEARNFSAAFQKNMEESSMFTGNQNAKKLVGMRLKRLTPNYVLEMYGMSRVGRSAAQTFERDLKTLGISLEDLKQKNTTPSPDPRDGSVRGRDDSAREK